MNKLTLLQQAKNNFYSIKTIVILWIFTFYVSIHISYALQIKMSGIDFWLYTFADPYIMYYVIFTVSLFSIAKISSTNYDMIIIRFNSLFKYWCYRVVNCLIYIVLLTLSIICLLLLISFITLVPRLGISSTNIFEIFKQVDILELYYTKINSSWLSMFLAIAYWLLGMAFFSIIINFIEVLFNKKIYIISCLSIYFFGALGVSKPIANIGLSFLVPTNYIILGYPLSLNTVYFHLIIMLAISTILILLIRYKTVFFHKSIERGSYNDK